MLKAGFDVRLPVREELLLPDHSRAAAVSDAQRVRRDVAEAANINKPLPGGAELNYYRWWDQYYFVQDDWRVGPNLTLNLGVRYELAGQ